MALSRSRDGFKETIHAEPLDDTSTDGREEPSSPPLLLPGPTTTSLSGRLLDRTRIMVRRASHMTGITSAVIEHVFRLTLFLVKLASLAQPCWPYVPALQVSMPLILIAALDLRATSGGISYVDRARAPARAFAVTMALLALHMSILWLSRRRNTLCMATQHEGWPDW